MLSGLFLISDIKSFYISFSFIYLFYLFLIPMEIKKDIFLLKMNLNLNKIMAPSHIKNSKKFIILSTLPFILFNFSSLNNDFICFYGNLHLTFMTTILLFFSIILFYIPFKFNFLMIQISLKKIPIFLMNFLILVEMLSVLIKPLTLIIRLVVNLVTGHLILELITKLSFLPMIILNLILMVMEIIVSIIQGLVFNLLLIFYSKD